MKKIASALAVLRRVALVVAVLAVVGLAAALLIAPGARALSMNPFTAYYDNVARAVAQNDTATVRRLVGTGSDPNSTDDSGHAGLHIVALDGNVEIAEILIKAGAQVNIKDRDGDTPLHLAAARDQVDIAKLLLSSGALVDPHNNDGITPLMTAASHGSTEMVRMLLDAGADPTATDYTGRDALSWAGEGQRPAIAAMLRRAAARHPHR